MGLIPLLIAARRSRSVAATPPPPVPVAALTSAPTSATRNNFGSRVGFEFTPSAAMSVTALGRWKVAGNSAAHTVRLFNGETELASVSVNMATGTAGAYQFVDLGTPISLAAGTAYRISSDEVNGGDTWYDLDSYTTTADVTINFSIHSNPFVHQSGGQAYVPPNFKYLLA